LKEYELVVLYHPDLEVDLSRATDKVAKIIDGAKGKIVAEDDWGRRRLAYPIRRENHAIYRVYTLELPPAAPATINAALNITDEVLRFLLSKVDPKIKALMEEEKKAEDQNESEKNEAKEEE
jgi:small subunit ribosomal protein S6